MVRATCSALHCPSSSRTHKDLKFHQFPHDAKRRKMWLLACKRSDVIDKDWDFFKHKYLCSKHFQKCMYTKKDYLKKSAVPSLHLSEKPLQHDSCTQTVESIQYVRSYLEQNKNVEVQSQNVASILYVTMPNLKKTSTSAYTQTIDVDIHQANIKEETITGRKIEESVIKTEKDAENEKSDSNAFEEDLGIQTESCDNEESSDSELFEDVKIDIVENPILRHALSSKCGDPEIMKDNETLCNQVKQGLQELDNYEIVTTLKAAESCEGTNPTNTKMMQRQDECVQTDRVIVIYLNPDGSGESINPADCKCKKKTYDDMTREQFFRCCSKFLSPNFSNLVRTQMYLDGVAKEVTCTLEEAGNGSDAVGSSSDEAEMFTCDEEEVIGHQEMVAPEDVVADTEMYLDGVMNDEAAGSNVGEGVTKSVERAVKRQKFVTPDLIITDIKTVDSNDRNDLSEL